MRTPMHAVVERTAPARAPSARQSLLRRALPWIAVAAIAGPVGVLLHELGHYGVGALAGCTELAFHHASVTGCPEDLPPVNVPQGLQAAAGPFITVLIALGSCWLTSRLGPRAVTVAPAFAAGVRTVAVGLAFLAVVVVRPDARGHFDEAIAARSFGLPPLVVVLASLVPILAAWLFLARRVPCDERAVALASIALGSVAGLAAYLGWIGPALHP